MNTDPGIAWATGILGQRRGSPSAPRGLIIRNNILCGLAEDISGAIENNIYTRPVEQRFMGPGCRVVTDADVLFRDPATSLTPTSPRLPRTGRRHRQVGQPT